MKLLPEEQNNNWNQFFVTELKQHCCVADADPVFWASLIYFFLDLWFMTSEDWPLNFCPNKQVYLHSLDIKNKGLQASKY